MKQGRNEKCNCGSRLKYKQCCGKTDNKGVIVISSGIMDKGWKDNDPRPGSAEFIKNHPEIENFITNDIFSIEYKKVIHTGMLITRTMDEKTAVETIKTFFKMKENLGPKFVAWLPLGNMKEMIISSNFAEDVKQGWEGKILSTLLRDLGLADLYLTEMKKMARENPIQDKAFKNIGIDWSKM